MKACSFDFSINVFHKFVVHVILQVRFADQNNPEVNLFTPFHFLIISPARDNYRFFLFKAKRQFP
jgi:hypothetical protein